MITCAPHGELLAKAAAELIGTRFRLHGRDPERGLDCVGLVHASLIAIGCSPKVPDGYRLRNIAPYRWFTFAAISGLSSVDGKPAPGDIVMVQPGPAQQHLLIAESEGVAIHAHAGLRRVVRQPISFPHRPLAHWRLL